MSTWAILLSGGSGTRMGAEMNKTLLPLMGECALMRALRALRRHCDGAVIVLRPEDESAVRAALADSGLTAEAFAYGGADRQESVGNGLRQLPQDCDIVLVHDGARPLPDDETIVNVIESVRKYGSGVASTAVTDTIKQVTPDGIVAATPDRSTLRAVQTPQGFRRDLLERAHREIGERCTDDAALVAKLGVPIRLTEGSPRNIKLTTPEDLAMADRLLRRVTRTGFGLDAHRLTEGRRLVLCGVEIPYEKGLLGHSDADAALHALTDALLGAAALGDIGQMFPDTDEKYAGISSLLLLKQAAERVRAAGFEIVNCDVTIVCQRPKLAPFIPEMRLRVAGCLGIEVSRVSVKATTTELMGYEGRGEGISAHAAATLEECLI